MSQEEQSSKKKVLLDGHENCNQCAGSGTMEVVVEECCPKCLGEGTIDWVEKVVGKKPKPSPPSTLISIGNNIYPNTFDVTGDMSITGDIVISGDSLRDKIEDLQEQLNEAINLIEDLRYKIEG